MQVIMTNMHTQTSFCCCRRFKYVDCFLRRSMERFWRSVARERCQKSIQKWVNPLEKPPNVSPDTYKKKMHECCFLLLQVRTLLKHAKGDANWLHGNYTKHMNPKELQMKKSVQNLTTFSTTMGFTHKTKGGEWGWIFWSEHWESHAWGRISVKNVYMLEHIWMKVKQIKLPEWNYNSIGIALQQQTIIPPYEFIFLNVIHGKD